MSEKEHVLKGFEKIIKRFAGKRIAIYGVGGHTQHVLENAQDTSAVVGLLDAKKVGETLWSYRVYDLKEIVDIADIIVVIARESVWRLIYDRIKHLTERGISIYSVNGDDLAKRFNDRPNEFENNVYWNSSLAELCEAICAHDVISFDIFDTLLMRKVIWQQEELSFENEKRLCVPRKDIVHSFTYALSRGKRVFLLSDMHLPSCELEELLEINGIRGYEELIVSCEHGETKEKGGLYEVLLRKAGTSSVLHIGDNPQADIIKASEHGISAYYIMSAYELLLRSPMYIVLSGLQSEADHRILGEFAASVLNSPFALCAGKGKLHIHSMEEVAAFFLPIVLGFMQWLIRKFEDAGEHTLLLFLARDGYLIKRLYDMIKARGRLNLPPSVYFLSSRSAVSGDYLRYRENYRKYARALGIGSYDRVAVYDLATKGTTIHGLREILGMELELVSFATFHIDETYRAGLSDSYLGNFSYYSLPLHFLKYYELLEIMCKPHDSQFLYFADSMEPVYAAMEAEKHTQWEKIDAFQDAILQKAQAFISSDESWLYGDISIKVADEILGLIATDYTIVADDVKEAFVFESIPEGVEQTQWWDRLVD